MAEQSDSVDDGAAVVWNPEVAAMVGPGLAATERDLGRILSPAERLMFLRGYAWRCQQELEDLVKRIQGDRP